MRGDHRPVRTLQPALLALAVGALLAPDHATVLGPDVDTWLQSAAPDPVIGRPAELTSI